ncbi:MULTISPECIES: hypothetical protein [Actinomadura]|uniref:Uncharacterized protein n=1 Tax=Actinomadura yumaensis TaxID=111807 RepID=A0ABW2CID0_9ACTN|nr:hypothetical protein [Actinomadura sp. J1-007]MWK37116.1 hypothetical protein [Actinomadura sp. J1-007]
MKEKLASLEIAASNGVLFIEDPELGMDGFLYMDELPVAASRSRVVVQVLHAVDGLTTVAVFEGDGGSVLPVEYYDAEFVTESGSLAVRDVEGLNRITVDVGAAPFRLRIFADRTSEPSLLEIIVPTIS